MQLTTPLALLLSFPLVPSLVSASPFPFPLTPASSPEVHRRGITFQSGHVDQIPLEGADDQSGEKRRQKVPVTLGVMSRCADSSLCESVFDKVVDRVGSKMNVTLSYLADVDKKAKYGMRCKHGDQECLGNIQQLCMHHHLTSPQLGEFVLDPEWKGGGGGGHGRDRGWETGEEEDPKDPTPTPTPSPPPPRIPHPDPKHPSNHPYAWWSFIQCQNYAGIPSIGTDSLARLCANVIGIDYDSSGVRECVEGPEGRRLLRESAARTVELGIERSCTILLPTPHKRCVLDDGRWQQCDDGHQPADFVAMVNKEWERLNVEE